MVRRKNRCQGKGMIQLGEDHANHNIPFPVPAASNRDKPYPEIGNTVYIYIEEVNYYYILYYIT